VLAGGNVTSEPLGACWLAQVWGGGDTTRRCGFYLCHCEEQGDEAIP